MRVLENKNALVCGASRGIGLGAAKALAAMGCRVVLLGRTEEDLKSNVKQMDEINGLSNAYVVADLSNTESLISKISTLLATSDIQIVINNSGGPAPGLLVDSSVDQLTAAFTNHILASHTIAKLVIPSMKKSGYGRFINVVSTSVRQPIPGLGVSNTIRGAMGSWSKTLANEVGQYGITVNNILPGATKTARLDAIIQRKQAKLEGTGKSAEEMMQSAIPIGRFGEVEEIANVIAFLASPGGSYISGTSIPVDGGRLKCI